MSTVELAAKLKEQGNTLFLQKDYLSAARKYTEALEADGENAILYANRAACRLNLREFLDAGSDARKAMGEPHKSVQSWKTAIAQLPKDSLTPSQLNQKAEYEKGLAAAKTAFQKLEKDSQQSFFLYDMRQNPPWIRAQRLIPRLREQRNYTSSAWAMAHAYNEFSDGVRLLTDVTLQSTSVLTCISNAILTDSRVFAMPMPDFVQRYSDQVAREARRVEAWIEFGPDRIKQETLKRLEEEGWDSTRPAFATTIRAWIMQGFLQHGLHRNTLASLEYFGRAIELIKWGRVQFSDVQTENRGIIFEDTFLRSVQVLHLDSLIKILYATAPNEDDATLDAALQVADEIIAGVDAQAIPPRESNPGFISAYYHHPKGRALCMKAVYYRTKAKRLRDQKNPALLKSVYKMYALATRYYFEAADSTEEDDEEHALCLTAGVQVMSSFESSARDQLAVMERIRLAIPKMKQIWGHSMYSILVGDGLYKTALEMEVQLREELKKGKIQLDDAVKLD
ncbi:hypothetical protein BT96DRAFT_937225 [Gymnopus androsaceus JB14]|uniref:TPR-like protein n=1 Tax=Gymnopus androsaceus JB14 TaxID=1447944 RepID=A0A6A4HZ03_9AGAR|nr:hypothetical protein BT96DRAFT_937225 [Gymnopus androsaceus JB14]